jgi:hypothetical protein
MPGRIAVMGIGLALLAATGAAFGQSGVNSVNGYTPAQRAKAEAAARAAGYTPTKIADVQAGYVLMWATKPGGVDTILTIAPDGTVHAGGVAHPTPPGQTPAPLRNVPP